MNLNRHPTKDQLRKLLGEVDDTKANHILWVDSAGEVHLSPLPADLTPVSFEKSHPLLRVRFEAFEAGNGYVGLDAATDEEWVTELYDNLIIQWRNAVGKPAPLYVEMC